MRNKAGMIAITIAVLVFELPHVGLALATQRSGFYMRPVGVYSGVVTGERSQSGLGGGLMLGGNFARGWVGGIEGGVTYTPYSGNMDVIDLFFGGVFGGSLGRFDLFANVGLSIPVVDAGGWDVLTGVKVGGGVDFWILDWLAVGTTGNFLWGYSLTGVYDPVNPEFNDMSRFTVQFGPKFRF